MAFAWPKMYKWDEVYQNDIDRDVESQVLEHYQLEEVAELTQEQINEILAFADENEHSIMRSGFYNLVNNWEAEQE